MFTIAGGILLAIVALVAAYWLLVLILWLFSIPFSLLDTVVGWFKKKP